MKVITDGTKHYIIPEINGRPIDVSLLSASKILSVSVDSLKRVDFAGDQLDLAFSTLNTETGRLETNEVAREEARDQAGKQVVEDRFNTSITENQLRAIGLSDSFRLSEIPKRERRDIRAWWALNNWDATLLNKGSSDEGLNGKDGGGISGKDRKVELIRRSNHRDHDDLPRSNAKESVWIQFIVDRQAEVGAELAFWPIY